MSRIEDEVCKKIQARAAVGKEKYGVTMETAPLSKLEWMVHLSEELMDATVYLQKLIEIESAHPRRDVCWWCGGKYISQGEDDE